MTSAPITDIGAVMPYINDAGGTKKADGADFMGTFKNAIETQATSLTSNQNINSVSELKAAKNADENSKVSATGKTETNSDRNNSVNRDKVKNQSEKKNVAGKDEKVSAETVDAVTEKAEEVIAEVADGMGVTKEEVIDAMEELGLGLTDLLTPSNMTELVMTLSGNEDTLSLLTDANLYQTLENLQNFVLSANENLMEELDLSQEALDEVLMQTEELLKQPFAENEMLSEVGGTQDVKTLDGMKDFKMTVTENGEQMNVSVRVDEATGAQVATVTGNSAKQSETEDSSEDSNHSENEENNSKNDVSLFTTNMQLNNVTDISGTQGADQISYLSPTAQNIAEQIMDNMKINLKPEITELEMNLHPASLGNVRVNLTANNGQVTAQFIAQNEIVRSAIESQITMLTKQLEEQGVKIEAVEVTLASHQFENNSSQSNTDSEQSKRQSQAAKIARPRRIDLGELLEDEALEELDDAEKIAADIMVRNGNSIDYMA